MEVFVYIGITVLCLILLFIELSLFNRYFKKGMKLKAAALSLIAGKIMALPPCSIGNLENIGNLFESAGDAALIGAFSSYRSDAVYLLRQEITPEASGYFHCASVYSIPRVDYYGEVFKTVSATAAILLFAFPPAWALFFASSPEMFTLTLPLSFGLSLLCLIWISVLHLIFKELSRKIQLKALLALEAIDSSLRYALPTAGKETQAALLMESVQRAKESFAGSADLIAAKIDGFVTGSLVPAAAKAFEYAIESHIRPVFASMDGTLASLSAAILEKQEEGLKLLAENFSERLYSVIGDRMSDLGKNTEKLNNDLAVMTDKLAASAEQINLGLQEDRKTLREAAGTIAGAAEAQQSLADGMSAFSLHLSEAKILTASMRELTEQILSAIKQTTDQNVLASAQQAEWLTNSRTELSEAHKTLRLTLSEADAAIRSALSENAAQFVQYGADLEKKLNGAMDIVQNSYQRSDDLMKEHLSAAFSSIKEHIDAGLELIGVQSAELFAENIKQIEDGRTERAEVLENMRYFFSEAHDATLLVLSETREFTQSALSEAQKSLRLTISENTALLADYSGKFDETLAAAAETVQKAYEHGSEQMSEQLAANAVMMRQTLDESRLLINESLTETGGYMKQYIDAGGAHMRSVAEDLTAAVIRQENMMNENLDKLVSGVSGSLQRAMDSNADTAERLGKTLDLLADAGAEQYEKAARAAASLLENIVTEINRAMEGVGKEIADSIGKATGESFEIVSRLTEQTAQLKQEYDTYFTRVEEQNRNSYDDLDYHIQNITARFAEETKVVISKLQESISAAMGLFEGNTATLLSNLDEQSRSIGLYAKELSYDISSLSSNLKEAVEEFSGHLHEGVVRTFDDFDAGLSEISKRLANTVESIRDSVENLPLALSDPNKLKKLP